MAGNEAIAAAIKRHHFPGSSLRHSPPIARQAFFLPLLVGTALLAGVFITLSVAISSGAHWSVSYELYLSVVILLLLCLPFTFLMCWTYESVEEGLLIGSIAAFSGAFLNLTWNTVAGNFFSQYIFGSGFLSMTWFRVLFGPWQDLLIFSSFSVVFCLQVITAALSFTGNGTEILLTSCQFTGSVCGFLAAIFGVRYYHTKMQHPWFNTPNFPFYAFCVFLSLMACNIFYWADRIARGERDDWSGFTTLTRIALPVVIFPLVLQVYRIGIDVEGRFEHRNFITEHMYPSVCKVQTSMFGAWLFALAALTHMVSRVVSWSHDDYRQVVQVSAKLLMSLAFAVLLQASASGKSPLVWWCRASYICFAVATLYSIRQSVDDDETFRPLSSIITGCGAVAMIGMTSLFAERDAGITFHPHTWLKILHPAHSCTLIAVFNLMASIFDLREELWPAAAACWLLSSWIHLMHCAAACIVITATHDTEQLTSTPGTPPQTVSTSEQLHPDVTEEFDVLICGASIAGLMLAAQLGRERVRTKTIEKRFSLTEDARFMFMNPRSRNIYHRILDADLINELLLRAVPEVAPLGCKLLNGVFQADSEVVVDLASIPPCDLTAVMGGISFFTESLIYGTRYTDRPGLRIMQSHQEAVLYTQVLRFPSVDVSHGCQFLGFQQPLVEGKAALSVVEYLSEERKKKGLVRSKFVVGADGPSSQVSKCLGATFSGLMNLARPKTTLIQSENLLNTLIEKVGLAHQFFVFRPGVGITTLVPADPARSIITCNTVFGYGKWKNKSASEILTEILGTTDFTIHSDSYYYWNFFIADKFAYENTAFLIGDSAHSWPPLGGTGGNTAYGDATCLAWKLIHALSFEGRNSVLQTYDCERRQHDLKVGLMVLHKARTAGSPQRIADFVCSNGMKWWPYRKVMENMFAQAQIGKGRATSGFQFGFKLIFSPIIHAQGSPPDDSPSKFLPCLAPGAYLPDYETKDSLKVHDCIHSSRYTILVVGTDAFGSHAVGHAVANALIVKFQQVGAQAHVISIDLKEPNETAPLRSKTTRDLYLGLRVIVVRPDLYVAWTFATNEKLIPGTVERTVSILLGLPDEDIKPWLERQQSKIESYLRFLVRRFADDTRPIVKTFPNALLIKHSSKASAIKEMKSRVQGFKVTTKTEAEGKS